MITENNVIESIKDSVNLADVSPENFESTIEFIHRQYEIVLKAKDKEIEKCYQEISHLRKMVESLAEEPIIIHLENHNIEEDHSSRLNGEIIEISLSEGSIQEMSDLAKTQADKPTTDFFKRIEHKVNRDLKSLGVSVSFGIDSLAMNTESSELVSSPIERVDSKQKVSSLPKTPRNRTIKTAKRK